MFLSPHDMSGAFSDTQMSATKSADTDVPDGEWRAYGRTDAGRRYSPLDQITPANVANLQPAWTYHTGDIRGPNDPVEFDLRRHASHDRRNRVCLHPTQPRNCSGCCFGPAKVAL